ncbi:MAG: heavy metal-responsive transcriptional regulator [Planctomycetes bacterium]|nr:heavy metal-responsive transcriptional regulator [Planctomycetota bacterium]
MTMTVGELSKQAGVNLETVRFYEKQRLLPEPERTPGGHRLYTQDDVDRLSFIQRAKWVGFTLKEIRTLMRVREADPTESCEDAMELARHKVGEINAKLDELQKMRDALQTFLDTCPDTDAGHCHVIQGLQSVEPPACCD